jgi:hypothetical protein
VNIMQYIRLEIMINNLITFTLGLRSYGLLYSVCWWFLLTFLDWLSVPFSRVRLSHGQAVQLPVRSLTVGPITCTEMSVNNFFLACAAPRYLNFWSSIALHFSFNTGIKQRSKCRVCEFWGCFFVAEYSVLVLYVTASLDEFMQCRMPEQRNSQILG